MIRLEYPHVIGQKRYNSKCATVKKVVKELLHHTYGIPVKSFYICLKSIDSFN
jgi:hypothetical protein